MHFTHPFFFIYVLKISRRRTIHQKSVASMPNLIDFLANWVQYTGIYPSLLPLCFAKIVTFPACPCLWSRSGPCRQGEVFSFTFELPQWLDYVIPYLLSLANVAPEMQSGTHLGNLFNLLVVIVLVNCISDTYSKPRLGCLPWSYAKIHQTIQNILLQCNCFRTFKCKGGIKDLKKTPLLFSLFWEDCNVK